MTQVPETSANAALTSELSAAACRLDLGETMDKMHYYLDTHDRANGTFPAEFSAEQLRGFFATYDEACRAEGVTIIRLHVSLAAGRAFCLTMAADSDAVRRAHERVGLPFDEITEVTTITPADLYLTAPVA